TEILKMLMIKNGIRRTKEGYVPTERFKKLEVAESVSSVILDQIDRMSELDRRILQYASVLGRSFEPTILSKILKISESNLVEELERLEHFEGFLVSKSETNTYEFTTPTTYEVVYNSLLKTKRKELHTEIGRELERIPEEKIFENLERLAHHFARSNDERKGVHYLKSAADKSYRLYALKETLNFFDQALELLHKKELSSEELRDKMEILRRSSLVLRLTGNLFNAVKYQKLSLTIARKLKSSTDEAGANLNMGEILRQMGQPKKALNYLLKARKTAQKIGNKNIQALAENNLGNYYMHIGNLNMAERCFLNVINLCIEFGDRRSMALANLNLGNVAERKDNLISAIKYYSIAHSIFEDIGDKENTLRSLHQIAISQMLAGDIDKCLSNLKNLIDLSVKYGDRLMESLALGSIGEVYGRMWQLDKAYEYFSKSLAIVQMLGEPQQNIVLNINIGDVHLYQGNLMQATGYHKKAVEIAKKIQDPFNEALAHRSLGLDYYYSGNYKEAIDELSQSINIFEGIGDRRNRIISLLAKEIVKIKIGYTKEIEQMLNDIEKKAREVNDLEILSLVLDAKADGIINTKKYENAQPILEQLSDLTRQIGNKRLFAWTNAKLSEVQFNIGLSNQGEKTLEKTLRLAQELGDRILESFVYLINAKRLVKITEYVKALNLLMKANELANQCSSKQLLAESLLITGEIYRRLGKNKDSEEYFKNYKKIVKEMTKEFSQGNKKNLSKFSD
ncbi:MAG: tetratricopeptide repeat protein, partial [candidate division WOR-3 bacterium]